MFALALKTTSKRAPCLATATILVVGLLGTLAGSVILSRFNARTADEAFEHQVDGIVGQLQDRMGRYEYMLRGLRGAITAVGEANLTRTAYEAYTLTRDIAREFPGARGQGFIRRVPAAEESAFVARARQDGAPDFTVRQLAPHSGERDVIQYVAPIAENRQALGLDIASEARRREAAVQSMDSGLATLTAPITLVQASGLKERGFLLFLPVNRLGLPLNTPEERRTATYGWTYAPLVIDEILASLPTGRGTIALSITDRTADETVPFFTASGAITPDAIGLHRDLTVTVFNRSWLVEARAQPSFIAGLHLVSPTLVAVVGIVLSLLAASVGYLRLSSGQRQAVADREKSRLAAIVQSTSDAIIGKTVTGLVTDWNPAAEHLFGFPAKAAIGRAVADLIIPPHLRFEEAETLAAIARGEAAPSRSTLRRHRDGTLIAVLANAAPIHAADGRVVGVASTIRDIRDQVAAEEHIRSLHADLERQVIERTAELKATSALQRAILDQAGYAVIATDTEGRITLFNPAAERMLGYDAAEMIERATPALIHDPLELQDRAAALSQTLGHPVPPGLAYFDARDRSGLPNVEEWTYLRKDGSRLPVMLNVSRLRSEDGRDLGFLGIASDLLERARHETEMRAAQAGTWNYQVATGLVRMSAECARQHGLGAREVEIDVETQWKPLAHPDDVSRVLNELQASIAHGGSYTIEYRIPQTDGTMRWLTAIGQAKADRDGAIVQVIGLTLDITARKVAEQALLDARAEADRANRAKTDFLAAMSHEIRTPLNAIIGFTDRMIRTERLDPENRHQADLVRSSGRALLMIVNDILDFSKVEAGAIELERRAFNPAALAENCLSIIRGMAEPKGLSIRAILEPDLPDALLGDEGRIRQILLNLLNNAVKFTRSGSVTLVVRHEGRSLGGEDLRFSVIDTGIGIPPEKQPRLFHRFSQVDGSIHRDFGGTGLGLAICKSLVELMGGEIGVASRENRGSTFWFTLTLPSTSLSTAPPVPPEKASSRQRGFLLLVEDSEINQLLARSVLEDAGHRVHVVSDGAAAVMAVEDGHYDLVLMDIQMPGMDGITATRLIRRLKTSSAQVPILAMTANVLPEQIASFRDVGMNGHVAKPFEQEALLAEIERWLTGVPAEPEDKAVPVQLDRDTLGQLSRRLAPTGVRDLVEMLVREISQSFRGGHGSVEERDQLRREAHSLTAAAGALGFVGLSAACRTLDSCREPTIEAHGLAPFLALLTETKAHGSAVQRDALELITSACPGDPLRTLP